LPNPDEARWLDAAARLAGRGRPLSRPNPAVGAIVVKAGRVVGQGWTRPGGRPHAEAVALDQAGPAAAGATLYVTLEPCVMCAGAMVNARVARLVYGADDPKAGACTTLYTIGADTRLNHRFSIEGGVLAEESADRLRRFFAALRAQGKK
jgi:tRNA(Arg) A34 adenosine deaminase TadA